MDWAWFMIKSRPFPILVICTQDLFQFSWFVIKTYSSSPKISRSSSEAADPSTDSQSCAHCPSHDKLDCMGSGNLTKYWAPCVIDMFLFHLEMEGEIAFVTKSDFSSFELNALQLLQWDNSLIFPPNDPHNHYYQDNHHEETMSGIMISMFTIM